jgi:hypothetical protein
MNIEFDSCVVSTGKMYALLRVAATFEELEKDQKAASSYRSDVIRKACIDKIASTLCEEYLKEHKMDIVNKLSKDDIVNAIQLKMIEGFSIGRS